MIPTLFEKNETAFLTKGIGALADALTCIVTEERNGIFELSMTYPIDGGMFGEIQNDRIILAKPNETMQTQPFRIYNITAPLNGVITVSAEHISYQLNSIPVFPFTAGSCPEAVAGLVSHSAINNPFVFTTDKTTTGTFTIKTPVNFRSTLYGMEGSLVDVYGGGDYLFDRWNIKLMARRGQDNGVTIEYGKNLTDLKQEMSIASLVTGVAPYWSDGEGALVTLPEKVITIQNDYSYERVMTLDMSQDFEESPTPDELRDAATKYIESTNLKAPKVSITVSFIPLWQTENYKENPLYAQIAGLERVSLCDTVRVRYVKLGVDATARVIKTVYDVLMERYQSVSIGEPTSTSVTRTVDNQIALDQAPTVSFMEQAIQNMTNAITGATGGYVVLDPPQHPQRLLIMDSPNKDEAQHVWQWNLNGLAYSGTGIDGPYTIGMNMNGQIVADLITAGVLNANIIKAGVLQSINGVTSFDLSTGVLQIKLYDGGITLDGSGLTAKNTDGMAQTKITGSRLDVGGILLYSWDSETSLAFAGVSADNERYIVVDAINVPETTTVANGLRIGSRGVKWGQIDGIDVLVRAN